MSKCLYLLLAVCLLGCGRSKQTLNIFIWSEYLDPKIVADFEEKFDCKVTIDLYEDADSMVTKLAAGGTSAYDIVVPSNTTLPGLVKRGLLAPLRHENIPNFKNVDPQFLDQAFDRTNQFSAPYQWGTTGLYIRNFTKPVEETWGLIFDPARTPGPFLLIDDMRHSFSAALKYRGHSVNSIDPKELLEARDLLLAAKKRSLGFEGTVGGKNRVLAKGAKLAMVVNGDAARGVAEDPETYFFVPAEGGEIFIDLLSIPKQAPHRELAEKFINFILDAQVGARLSNFNQFGTPNKASLEFINPADLKNPALYPPPPLAARLEFAQDLGDQTKVYTELWTQIKSK